MSTPSDTTRLRADLTTRVLERAPVPPSSLPRDIGPEDLEDLATAARLNLIRHRPVKAIQADALVRLFEENHSALQNERLVSAGLILMVSNLLTEIEDIERAAGPDSPLLKGEVAALASRARDHARLTAEALGLASFIAKELS